MRSDQVVYPFRLPPGMWDRVKAAAQERGWSYAVWLREAVREKLDRDEAAT